MALKYHPKPGAIILCDYTGFKVPEMVKTRPVVVVSPRLRNRDELCTVVPLSTTEPNRKQLYHCEIEMVRPLPAPWVSIKYWVKADMLATVGFHRLSPIRIGQDHEGKRKYLNYVLNAEELQNVRDCVLQALGLPHLTNDD